MQYCDTPYVVQQCNPNAWSVVIRVRFHADYELVLYSRISDPEQFLPPRDPSDPATRPTLGGGGSSSLKGPSRGALGGCFWGPFAMSLQGEEPLALSLFSPPGETGGGMKGHDEHGETEMRGEARRGVCRRLLKRPTHRHARPGSKSRTLAHLAPVTGAVDLLEAGVSMESRLGFCQQRQNDEN